MLTLVSVEAVSARHPARRPPPSPGCAVWWVVPACSQHSGEGVLCPGPRRAELQHPEHTVCEFSAWLTRTRPVLWVIIQRYLVLPICSSNRSSLGHRTPFQLAPVSLCHTPLVGFSSLSTSLLFCSTRWSWRDLYVSCPSLRISHCSKEPWFLLWRWGWKPGPGCPTCVSLLGWETKGIHTCKYMWLCAHMLL